MPGKPLVVKCASSMLVCKKCHVTFKKKEYLAKHMKLNYAEIDLARESEKDIPGPSCLQKDDSDSGSDWDEEETPNDKEHSAETNAVTRCLDESMENSLCPVMKRLNGKSSAQRKYTQEVSKVV